MRVGIDAHVLDGREQGSKTMLVRVLGRLARQYPDDEFFVYAERPHPGVDFSSPNLHFRPTLRRNPIHHLLIQLPRAYRADRLDTMVYNYIGSPLTWDSTIVMHDVLPISRPKLFTRRFALQSRLFFALSSKLARRILVVSTSSGTELQAHFPWAAGKWRLMHLGPSFDEESYFAEHAPARPACIPQAGRYALCVGRLDPRKNIQLAIDAFRAGAPADAHLVIVGQAEPHVSIDTDDDPRIVRTGSVSDAELVGIYRNASLFLYPSAAEGFGLPLLDALLFGLPVISSDRTSMPEVGGSAPLYFNPEETGAMAFLTDKIAGHFGDQPVLPPSLEARRERASTYSWSRAADDIMSALSPAT